MKSYYVAKTPTSGFMGRMSLKDIFTQISENKIRGDFFVTECTEYSYTDTIKRNDVHWEPVSQLVAGIRTCPKCKGPIEGEFDTCLNCAKIPVEVVNDNSTKPNQSNGNWWLAAILFPVVGFVFGYFFAIAAPHNESDWFGLAILARVFVGLLIGCVLSTIATLFSIIQRERFFGFALLAGIPSLIFVVNVCSYFPQAEKNTKQAEEHFHAHLKEVAKQHKQETEQEARAMWYREEFRTNSSLITNDAFWNAQTNQDRSVQAGLGSFDER